jgi:UDP-N-acetylglucosamine--N-acetylmuramyl-(pentapeptide) pyrophosphoryl-undecaprenol N-acetylglucosamine transferase
MTTVLISAGGTGGHMFPAEALARELLRQGVMVHLITDSRGKAFGDALPEIPVHRVSAATPTGGLVVKVRAVLALLRGIMEARCLVRQLNPDVVVGFGGYPSIPGVAAGLFAGKPVVLHDQNAVLGRANRMVARYARAIAKSFEDVIGMTLAKKSVLTGNPVRPAILALRDQPYTPPLQDGAVHLLFVTGGSLGARIFSQVVPQAIGLLDEGLRSRLHITQQARAEDLQAAQQAYADLGMGERVTLAPFFTNMPELIAQAHLCIGRAGGSTVAEWSVRAVRPFMCRCPLPFLMSRHGTPRPWSKWAAHGFSNSHNLPRKPWQRCLSAY